MNEAHLGLDLIQPTLCLTFAEGWKHPQTGDSAQEWMGSFPGSRLDGDVWTVTTMGLFPDQTLERAGFVALDPDGELVGLNDLTLPVAVPEVGDPQGRWRVTARLGGAKLVEDHLDQGRVSEREWLVSPESLLARGCDFEPAGWLKVDRRFAEALRSRRTQAAHVTSSSDLVFDSTLDGLRGIPTSDLKKVNRSVAEAMSAVGIETVYDLIHHIPRRYLDLSNPQKITEASTTEPVAILGRIQKVVPPKTGTGMLRVVVADSDKKWLSCRYFHAAWMAKKFKVGMRVIVFGKLEPFTFAAGGQGFGMTNPMIEILEDDVDSGSILGIYPASGKNDLTTWMIQRACVEATSRLGPMIDPVPQDLLSLRGLPSRTDAYRMCHAPTSLAQTRLGRDRLAYDELLRLQLVIASARAALKAEDAYHHLPEAPTCQALLESLPYQLTSAQRRTIEEITTDMTSVTPANRLIQGDVGSGKTVVSAAALLRSVDSGWQGAFIAPTEILASQHFESLIETLSDVRKPSGQPVSVALLTNRVTGAARRQTLSGLSDGTIDIVVGTHSLLSSDVKFAHLSAVVVDEQHRFGIEQRQALRAKGNGKTPDTFYASATPIPRTAAMTIFGDLDVSVLDELPPGRTPISTHHLPDAPTNDPASPAWAAIRRAVASGQQAFVVTPLVASSQTRQDAAAHATAEDLLSGALAGLRVAVVTGKDKASERAETMRQFSEGTVDVLVATTVIEVGVNVPNATVMVILGADKFGLAQLHQLRGRVGRGFHPGLCFLVAEPKTSAGQQRLEAMCATTDGFVLAERDLAIRGAGQMSGTSQSGSGRDLRIASVLDDLELLGWAKADATMLVSGDPQLSRRPGLRAEVRAAIGEEASDWLQAA